MDNPKHQWQIYEPVDISCALSHQTQLILNHYSGNAVHTFSIYLRKWKLEISL